MNKEIRSIEIRAVEYSRTVEGYALVFNSLSKDLGGFREEILPDALDGVIERSDIMALLNHDNSRGILARSRYGKGSLSLQIDDYGLKYRFEAPRTALGDELLEYLTRNDITSSSFAFTVSEDNWKKEEDGSYIRTIRKFDKLFDVSPVFEPAYDATSVVCARFAEIQEEERLANEKAMKEAEERALAEEAEKRAKLDEYYNALKENNKDYMPE
jgi:HK97 family phage prohead protease